MVCILIHRNKQLIIYTLLGLFIMSCQNDSKQVISVINYPKTDKSIVISSKIDSVVIKEMTPTNLRLLRNEIFARHGYIFMSKELTRYFSNFDWYNPTTTANKIDNKLTEIDRYNISLIKSAENYHSKNDIKWDNQLQAYLDLIPKIKLPFHFKCEEGFKIPELDYENNFITEYRPEGASIIGKLYQNQFEAALIYGYPADIFYPIISVIDKTGKELRKIRFFELRNCVDDIGYSATTTGIITKSFEIKTKTKIITRKNENSERDIQTFENEVNIK